MSANVSPLPQILIAAFNGYLVGVNPLTGAVVWELPERDVGAYPRLYVTPTYTLVLGGGFLHCVETNTGRVYWRAVTYGETLLYPGGDHVFVSPHGELECFLISNGQRLWKQEFAGKGHASVALGVPGLVAQLDKGR